MSVGWEQADQAFGLLAPDTLDEGPPAAGGHPSATARSTDPS